MQFRTKDGTLKHVEVMVMTETLRYYVVSKFDQYYSYVHREKDSNVEDWLAGNLNIFQTYEDYEKYQLEEKKKQEKQEKKKASYVV